MPETVLPEVHPLRGIMGWCHLLVDENRGMVLLDTGLAGELWLLRRLLRKLGKRSADIQAILLTHGHLDHAGNLAALQQWCGAPVYAHPVEQEHIDGTYFYRGHSQWCGRMEALGRRVFSYTPGRIDHFLHDGQNLPFWGGLRVVHLPGHTEGHCGFFSPRHDLLFSGDLFASYFFNTHLPPPILNSAPHLLPSSLKKVRDLNPRRIVPNHYDFHHPALHRRRFDRHYNRFWTQSRRWTGTTAD